MTRKVGKTILDTKVNKNNKNKEKTFDEFRRDTELSNMYDVTDWATKSKESKPKKIKKPSKQEVAAQKLFNRKFRVLTAVEIAQKKLADDLAYNKALVDEPKYADEALDFVKGWHDSPMYKQMILNSLDGNQVHADYVTELRKENIANIPPINIMATSGTSAYGFKPSATSNSETGEVKVYPEGFGWGPSMYTHEYFHSSDRPRGIYNLDLINIKDPRFPNDKKSQNRVIPESDQMYITRNRGSNWKDNQEYKTRIEKFPDSNSMTNDEEIKQILYSEGFTEDDKDFQQKFTNLKNIIQTNHKEIIEDEQKEWKIKGHDYISQPTEVRARLGEIRHQARKEGIYDPFIKQITPEIFQNYINKKRSNKNRTNSMGPIQDLRKQFTDEEILWMLQNISKNNEGEEEIKVAARGGAPNKFEEEGIILDLSPEEIEEYRKGGYVIEDISVPSLNHMNEGGAINKFVDGGENDKDKKKRKWLRGTKKGLYVSEDDPNVQRYNYLEGLDMTAEEFSEKYPGYSSTLQYIPEIKITGKKQSYWDRMMKNMGQKKLNNKIKEKTFDEFRQDTELNMHDVFNWAAEPKKSKPKKPTKKETAAQKVFDEAFRVLTPGEILINQRLKDNGLHANSFKMGAGNRTFPIFDSKGEYASPEAQTYVEKRQNQNYLDRQVKNNYNDGALEGFHPEVYALAPGGLLNAGAEVLTGTSEIMAPYLATEIAGISGATAGNALTAYGIGKAGTNATGNIIEGNYWDAAYDAGKGLLTALPLTKFGNASLYPELNNWRSAISFGTSGIDASLAPSLFNDFNAIRKAPNNYVSPISPPSSSPSVFSTVVGKLKKQKGGAIEKNMSKSEIKKLIAQGYVIEEI